MGIQELKKIVGLGEGQYTEFKKKAAHPDKIMKEVVAFANANGGRLLIGVDDDKTIAGLKFPDEEEFTIEAAIRKYCYPEITYTVTYVALSAKLTVLVFDIQPGNAKPYYVRTDAASPMGKAYIRVNDRSVQASKEVRDILKQQSKERPVRFVYGDKEQALMQYIDAKGAITVGQLVELCSIPRKLASRTLVLLVLAGVLQIHPEEGEDTFTARPI